jgi:hypothetical protein
MKLKGVDVAQPARHGPFQLRLKFGKQAYCVIEVRPGEDAADVAKKLRELAEHRWSGSTLGLGILFRLRGEMNQRRGGQPAENLLERQRDPKEPPVAV